MDGLVAFVNRMNLLLWIAVIALAHLLLYLFLGTDHWLFATVAATAVYAIVLLSLKSLARNKDRSAP
ncbi:hypothetical protein [Tumebacillus flagellatus]|uniref:Uncharacterized protein n=1 Tax=Tumebacillus flagellatus TaxID=1157490 RepID=A0A074LXF9_9BACL|nr:hypothetical protein [Tumebacillus flagellatus]KEO84798.1 hypothetical protein EL26_01955 [Tumebacillus flagellatus]